MIFTIGSTSGKNESSVGRVDDDMHRKQQDRVRGEGEVEKIEFCSNKKIGYVQNVLGQMESA